MPKLDAETPVVIFSGIASLPTVSRSVAEDELTLRVRRVAGQLELCAELCSADTGRACTLTLPRMQAGTAVALAKVLLEMASGHEVDVSAILEGRHAQE